MQLTMFHVVPRLRMHEAIPLVPHTFLGYEVQLRIGTTLPYIIRCALYLFDCFWAHLRNRKAYCFTAVNFWPA